MKSIKSMIAVLLIAVTGVIVSGCGASIPESSGSDVQKLVIQIAEEKLADEMAPVLYPKVTGIPVALLGAKVTYKDLKAKASGDTDAGKVVAEVNAALKKTEISLENIRTDKIDEKGGKSYSSANLKVGKKKFAIKYTAQYNTDGVLYVEVSGLEKIYDKYAAPVLKGVKALPLTETVTGQIAEFKKAANNIRMIRKDDFESDKECIARVGKEKIKLYRQFFKNNISKNTFELICPSEYAKLSFDMGDGSISYREMASFLNVNIENLFFNSNAISSVDVDFAGILKTAEDRVDDYSCSFKCSTDEAKMIKKNLGGSWEFNTKLWLQFKMKDLEWHIVKIYILTKKK